MYRDLFELVPAAAAGMRPRLFCTTFLEAENLVRSGTLSLWDLRTDGTPRQPDQVCAIVPSLAGWITRHLRSPSGTPGTGHINVETLLLQMAGAELRSLRLRVHDLEQVIADANVKLLKQSQQIDELHATAQAGRRG